MTQDLTPVFLAALARRDDWHLKGVAAALREIRELFPKTEFIGIAADLETAEGAATLFAQAPNRLQSRFDARTYAVLKAIIDSARGAKLPVKLIEDNALEGASSGASGARQATGLHRPERQDRYGGVAARARAALRRSPAV